jgi:hypothetical protein
VGVGGVGWGGGGVGGAHLALPEPEKSYFEDKKQTHVMSTTNLVAPERVVPRCAAPGREVALLSGGAEASKGSRAEQVKMAADALGQGHEQAAGLKRKREGASAELLRKVVRSQSAALELLCASPAAHANGLAIQHQGALVTKAIAQLLAADSAEFDRLRSLTMLAATAASPPTYGGAAAAAAGGSA